MRLRQGGGGAASPVVEHELGCPEPMVEIFRWTASSGTGHGLGHPKPVVNISGGIASPVVDHKLGHSDPVVGFLGSDSDGILAWELNKSHDNDGDSDGSPGGGRGGALDVEGVYSEECDMLKLMDDT